MSNDCDAWSGVLVRRVLSQLACLRARPRLCCAQLVPGRHTAISIHVAHQRGLYTATSIHVAFQRPGRWGLRLLRDRFPDRFVGGTVLYLGPLAYTAEDRIHVVPLDRLWM